MKKILVIYYSILYILGLISFVLISISIEYSDLGITIFIAGFLVFWIYGFFYQFTYKGFLLHQRNPLSFISLDIKNKFSKNIQLYIYISSAIFFSIVGFGFSLFVFYGGGPDIIDGVYAITNHGYIVKEGITKFEYDVLSFFEVQMFVCLSLLLHSGIIIYLKEKIINRHPLKSFNEFDSLK
ncbi:MAG: hypothetical protein CVV57_07200 [Tenericutes bacterium HGW-Tenericutes-2]|jgi:hypothetical protein|nr:MAG: hypothetical protein CVV57_07200 [Tenericutes bacterium HGW-Tenericutes-2]